MCCISVWECVSVGSYRPERARLCYGQLCFTHHICWETNLGPLQKQYMLLTTEPSHQAHIINNCCNSNYP